MAKAKVNPKNVKCGEVELLERLARRYNIPQKQVIDMSLRELQRRLIKKNGLR